jgi:hypothetical protein
MTPEQFAYWLQGYTELTAGQQPTPEQWKSITEHLKTVFVKITPELSKPAIFPLGGGVRFDPPLDYHGFRVREARDLLPNEIRITC